MWTGFNMNIGSELGKVKKVGLRKNKVFFV